MDRRPRHRRLLATALAGGALVAIAVPRLVAADPAPTVWPVDIDPTLVAAAPPSPVEPSDPVTAVVAPAPDPAPVEEPSAEPVAVPAPETVEEVADVPETPDVAATEPAPAATPAPAVPAATVEQPAIAGAAAEVTPQAGTLTVHVTPVDGADRFITVRPVDGGAGAGPLPVGSDAVVVDLAAGTYDLLVEQIAHGGGAFVTRIRFTMDPGGQVGATCDPATLECAVVA